MVTVLAGKSAVCLFVSCCGNHFLIFLRICSEVIAGVVTKCLNARPKTKELGISVCLMYVEIEKQDVVLVGTHTL